MLRNYHELLFLLLPFFGLICIFILVPAVWALYISFTNQALAGSAAANPEFVYFSNYSTMLTDWYFVNSLILTIVYAIITTLGESALALLIALILKVRSSWVKSAVLPLALIGFAAPISVSAYLLSNVFHSRFGSLNAILKILGITGPNWFFDYPLLTLIMCDFWINIGFYVLIFLSALENIPKEMDELAAIDGVSGFLKFRHVTLPYLATYVHASLILGTISGFSMFALPYLLTKGGPIASTELMSIYAYRKSFVLLDLGFGSAVSVFLIILAAVLGLLYLKGVKGR
jgi:multiple sugar transport system permease protein